MNRVKLLTHLAVAMVFLTIAVGGLVRAYQAGMGCGPDWPTCNGQVVPRNLLVLEVFLEYTHRVVAALAGLTVALAAYYTMKNLGPKSPATRFAVAALLLLIVQVIVGMVLVRLHLEPFVGFSHLVLASLVLISSTLAAVYTRISISPGTRGQATG